MRRLLLLAAAATVAWPAALAADATVVAARSLRARTVVTAADLVVTPGATPGAISDPAKAVGLETRVAVYQGRPLTPGDLAPPALVDRNQIVTMRFARAGLEITTEGRALGRAGEGERVRVMNLSSRTTVTATVIGPGAVEVR